MAERDVHRCRGQVAAAAGVERAVPIEVKREGARAVAEWLAGYDDELRQPTVELTLRRYPRTLSRKRVYR